MKGWIIFLSVVAIIWLIGMISANVVLTYDNELSVYIRVLFLKFRITPKVIKKPDPSKYTAKKYARMLEKQAKAEEKKAKKKKSRTKKTGGAAVADADSNGKKKDARSLEDIVELVDLVLELVKRLFVSFGKHLRITAARMRIKVATGDAATTAIAYGAVCQSVAYIVEILYNITNFRVKKSDDINVTADFAAIKSELDLKLIFRLRVWHVFAMLFAVLNGYIGKKLKNINKKESVRR